MRNFIAGLMTAFTLVAFFNYVSDHPTYEGIITYAEDNRYLIETECGDEFEIETDKIYYLNDRVEICMDLNGTDTQSDDIVKSIHLI